jgi:hypothetical protein
VAGRFGTDRCSPGYGLAVTATVVFDALAEVQVPEDGVLVVTEPVVVGPPDDDDVGGVSVGVVGFSVVDPVGSGVGVVGADEAEVVAVVVGLDPDDDEVVDASPVVVVEPVCDEVVVVVGRRLVVVVDERVTDAVVMVEGAGMEVPLPLRREERTAPEALVVDSEPSLSPSSRELTGKSSWSVASTPDSDLPVPSSNRLRLPDEPESARPLDPTGSASSAEPAETTPPAGSAVWSSEPSTTARTTATMIRPDTSTATVDRMASTPTAKRRSPGSSEPPGMSRMDDVAADSFVGAEGSSVGTERSSVGAEGSCVGAEGSSAGAEGSSVGAKRSSVGAAGSGGSSLTTSVLFDSGPIGIGRGAGRLRSSNSNSVVSTASRGENGDGLMPDMDAPACR